MNIINSQLCGGVTGGGGLEALCDVGSGGVRGGWGTSAWHSGQFRRKCENDL